MLFVSLYIFLIFGSRVSTFKIDLVNQNEPCVTFLREHLFENKQFHMDENSGFNFIYIEFEDFSQFLNLKCENISKIETDNLLLNAKRKVLVEEDIYLDEILNMMKFSLPNDRPFIVIRNIDGFNNKHLSSVKHSLIMSSYDLYFSNVNFNFYLNKTLITSEMCKYEIFYEKQIDFFSSMKNVFFNTDVFYFDKVCPYVFLKTQLNQIGLGKITNSLIFKNRLEFINIDNDDLHLKDITNSLIELKLEIQFDELTIQILSPYVFKLLKLLEITGSPYRIENTLFNHFLYLEYIIFNIENLRNFLHQGLEWTSFLNRDLNVTQKNIEAFYLEKIKIINFKEMILMDSMPTYIYPDEDLCLFKHFPHEQLVIPSVALIDDEEICSCTLIWLMKNYKIYSSRTSLKLRKDFRNYFNSSKAFRCMRNYSLLFHSCQFEKKFNNCLIIETNFRPRLTALNFFYLFEWLKLVLEVYFKTCLALLGVITNLLIMMVIKNKKQKVHLDNFMLAIKSKWFLKF